MLSCARIETDLDPFLLGTSENTASVPPCVLVHERCRAACKRLNFKVDICEYANAITLALSTSHSP